MKLRLILSCLALASFSLVLTGCGSSTEVTATNEVSVGQQLTDLDKARAQRIITDREYERLKKAIIKRYD